MAIGQTFVIATGGIDLSVGSLLGLSGVVMALVIRTLDEVGLDATTTVRSASRRRSAWEFSSVC